MEYSYSNQKKAKAEIKVDDFIMFAEKDTNILVSGTVVERCGEKISVLFETDTTDEVVDFFLGEIVLYRDKEWEDII